MAQRPKNFFHYQVIEQIGCGGMSVVYRALNLRTKEQVAIKVLHPFLASKEDCQRRLAREAQTISKLHHDLILRILDFSAEPGSEFFIVTELVEGLTLREFGERNQIWRVPEIGALIIREAALALQYAHDHNVIHRDIKPENIMIGHDGTIKLMDFGIAHVADQESLTMTGAMIGSPAHMAPEVIEGKAIDSRSDIFSLATVLYWLLTGEVPYDGTNPHTLLRNVVEGRLRSVEEVSARVTPALRIVTEKALATRPEQRFQRADELAVAIDKALSSIDIDLSTTKLRQLLKNPEQEFDRYSESIRESSITKARVALKKGQFLEGTTHLNRILADDSENQEALELWERHPYSSQKHPPFKAIAVVCLGSALLAGICTWLAMPGDSRSQPVEKPFAIQTPTTVEARPPKMLEAAKPPRAQAPSPIPIPRPKALITVTPFADIWIDGEKIATNSSRAEVPLEVGEHRVVFTHEFAATEERKLRIAPDSKTPTLHVDLERVKPASVVIVSNVEADVAINGAYKGTTGESLKRPILITFPKKSYSRKLEIIVSQKGFAPYIGTHTAVPGTKQNIDVTLEPG
jgi:serine/threonine-protein kinase